MFGIQSGQIRGIVSFTIMRKCFRVRLKVAVISLIALGFVYTFGMSILADLYHLKLTPLYHTNISDGVNISSSHNNSKEELFLRYRPLTRGSNIRVGDLDVAIITAVHYANFPVKNGFNVFLNGWAKHNSDMNFKCCFIQSLNSEEIVEVQAVTYHVYTQWKVDMQNAEFSCSIEKERSANVSGELNYVTFGQRGCENSSAEAVKIERRTPVRNSVGICLKISYGDVDPELIMEWFEYNKAIGVTKVFTFLFDLEPDARKVFLYYNSTGFLEAADLDPAHSKAGFPRGFRRPRWEDQAYVDEVTAINDCKHRMAGLDFVIVQDIDEYILPKDANDTIFTLLQKTLKKYPDAGGFSFDSHVIMLDWGPTRKSPLHIMRFTNRTTTANYDGFGTNSRWALISDRTYYGQNNKVWPRRPYKSVRIPSELYILVHRRMCKKDNWKDCLSPSIRVIDEGLTRYEPRLMQAMQKLPLDSILPAAKSKEYIQAIRSWKGR